MRTKKELQAMKGLYKVLSKKRLSIDFGSHQIKMVVGKQKKDQVIVEEVFRIPIPLKSYENGKILEFESLYQTIKEAVEEHKIDVKSVILGIQSSEFIYREIILPVSKAKELNKMIQVEIRQNLPIDINQYIVQGRVIERIEEDDSPKYRVLVGIVPKDYLTPYFQLIERFNWKPIAIDLHPNAISKVIEYSKTINEKSMIHNKTIAMIDIGFSSIEVIIFENGVLKFNRLLSLGSQTIDVNIANTFNLTLIEGERKKIDSQNYFQDKEPSSSLSLLQTTIEGTFDSWLEEIQKVFRYYTSRSFHRMIDAIYIYGGSASMEKLCSYFQENYNIPVEKIKTLDSIQWKNSSENLHHYLNAIAAFIRK